MSGGPPKPPRKNRAADEWDLVDAVARTLLHVNGSQELTALGGVLFPAMLGNAVARSDLKKLDELKGFVSIQYTQINYIILYVFLESGLVHLSVILHTYRRTIAYTIIQNGSMCFSI